MFALIIKLVGLGGALYQWYHKKTGERPSFETILLTAIGFAFFLSGMIAWGVFIGGTQLSWTLKVFFIVGAEFLTEASGIGFDYLARRLGAWAPETSLAELANLPSNSYIQDRERETFANLSDHLRSDDDQRVFYGSVTLWKLGKKAKKRVPDRSLVVRDKSDCMDKDRLDHNYVELGRLKRKDWFRLPEMAKEKYYTIIYRDLRVWEGEVGRRYFNKNWRLLERRSKRPGVFDFRRLFVFPHKEDFQDSLKTSESALDEGTRGSLIDACITAVNTWVSFPDMWREFKESPEFDEATQKEAWDCANAYFDMALLTKITRVHRAFAIPCLIGDARKEWIISDPEDLENAERDAREPLIYGSGFAPQENPAREKRRVSAALIDDASLIWVYTDEEKKASPQNGEGDQVHHLLSDLQETALIYEFRFEDGLIQEFKDMFVAAWKHRQDVGPTFFFMPADEDRFKQFIVEFSQPFADKMDGIQGL